MTKLLISARGVCRSDHHKATSSVNSLTMLSVSLKKLSRRHIIFMTWYNGNTAVSTR